MRTPITLNFYNENDEIIHTYTRSRVSWGMFKKAISCKIPEDGQIQEDDLKNILEFVCDFFDNQFTEQELMDHTDISEVMIVASQISFRVITIMREQGVNLPNLKPAVK